MNQSKWIFLLTHNAKKVHIIKETYVTANELSQIIGIPLPKVIEAIKCGRIKAIASQTNGIVIPLSQFYPSLWVYIK